MYSPRFFPSGQGWHLPLFVSHMGLNTHCQPTMYVSPVSLNCTQPKAPDPYHGMADSSKSVSTCLHWGPGLFKVSRRGLCICPHTKWCYRQGWWHTPVIPALGWLKPVDHEFRDNQMSIKTLSRRRRRRKEWETPPPESWGYQRLLEWEVWGWLESSQPFGCQSNPTGTLWESHGLLFLLEMPRPEAFSHFLLLLSQSVFGLWPKVKLIQLFSKGQLFSLRTYCLGT